MRVQVHTPRTTTDECYLPTSNFSTSLAGVTTIVSDSGVLCTACILMALIYILVQARIFAAEIPDCKVTFLIIDNSIQSQTFG